MSIDTNFGGGRIACLCCRTTQICRYSTRAGVIKGYASAVAALFLLSLIIASAISLSFFEQDNMLIVVNRYPTNTIKMVLLFKNFEILIIILLYPHFIVTRGLRPEV
jgi:hypothetical protein